MIDSYTLGLLSVFASVILYGLFSLPTKTNNLGDGMLFQLFMCIGIWFIGFIYYIIECFLNGKCSTFSPLAASGGAIWCLSNLLLTPIVKCIGVGIAMVSWGMNECLTGWATGRFGLFGVAVQEPSNPTLNTGGVLMMFLSLILISLAQPSVSDGTDKESDKDNEFNEKTSLMLNSVSETEETNTSSFENNGYDFTEKLSPLQKRIFGFVSCIICGALSGSTFTPPQLVVDRSNQTINLIDLLFSHYCGILAASISFFVIYCIAVRGKPWAKADILLPSLLSGFCWGLAGLFWFIANEKLSMVIAFPVVTIGPGVVSLVIGCVYFKEVKGLRNIFLLLASVLVYSAGAIMIAVSGS
jgi:glucose uptake protein GlcU